MIQVLMEWYEFRDFIMRVGDLCIELLVRKCMDFFNFSCNNDKSDIMKRIVSRLDWFYVLIDWYVKVDFYGIIFVIKFFDYVLVFLNFKIGQDGI